jgi:serine phosphatase RsbU (regulator of sigma subunit)/anti-sigma regulatory factor (Ser/Thr protein kinase)
MATLLQNIRLSWMGQPQREPQESRKPITDRSRQGVPPALDIAPNDPLVAYFLSAPAAVELDKLQLDSPALKALKAAGVQLVIPLVSQGELVGLLNLGPRLSEQDYSADDRGLLTTLATQAAPALRVAQLVQEQQAEIRARERLEQELRVARLIQQTLLPKDLPAIPGWQLAAYYQPARAVGGDFYDFLSFADGRLGLVVGDVTDKGVPAALVMATTRSILRAAAQGEVTPGQVLERTNDLLCPDIPPKMFVTCLYAILDPATGRLRYANAGHDLPYQRHAAGGVSELRATGMPLGLMPRMLYEEHEAVVEPGDSILLYSDGLVEAHNPQREMFSFPRLMRLVGEHAGGKELIDFLLEQLTTFVGPGWEQEDDVTMVTLQRTASHDGLSTIATASPTLAEDDPGQEEHMEHAESDEASATSAKDDWRVLGEWSVPSVPGNEREAMERVVEAIRPHGLPTRKIEQLATAVAEATMNAMEHGNHYQPDVPVTIQVLASRTALAVRIRDQGGSRPIPTPHTPDLEAKLAGLQSPRGWGLFLIKNLVDEMRVTSDETHHTIELIMHLEGEHHVSQNA